MNYKFQQSMLWVYLLILSPAIVVSQDMDNEIFKEVLTGISDSIGGHEGYWEIFVDNIPMLCITDVSNNRMRIMTPVSKLENLKKGQLKACMEANFHSALDVKYAISEEFIWVVFIHPLRELRRSQLEDGIQQVWNAVSSFGTTYNSTDLIFPGKVKEGPTKKM
jgi:hypothetical protein